MQPTLGGKIIRHPHQTDRNSNLAAPLSFAALAAGADGLIVEVHPDPETALSDGDQSLDFEGSSRLMRDLKVFAEAAGRTV